MLDLRRNHYAILGVHRGSTLAEIKAAYRALVSIMHPDRNGGTPEANASFAEVTGAYATLSDKRLRVAYDNMLNVFFVPCSECCGSGYQVERVGYSKKIKRLCPTCYGCGAIDSSKKQHTINL